MSVKMNLKMILNECEDELKNDPDIVDIAKANSFEDWEKVFEDRYFNKAFFSIKKKNSAFAMDMLRDRNLKRVDIAKANSFEDWEKVFEDRYFNKAFFSIKKKNSAFAMDMLRDRNLKSFMIHHLASVIYRYVNK